MNTPSDAEKILDSAENLFYNHGFQAVGMDAIREDSGLPLKRIYAEFGSKENIAVSMLTRRDKRWMNSLEQFVNSLPQEQNRVGAIFEWLRLWLASDGYRGCAWINAFGELGGNSPEIAEAVRLHKENFRNFIFQEVTASGSSHQVAETIYLLAEGSMVTAGITKDPEIAQRAGAVAVDLINNERLTTKSTGYRIG